MDLQIDLSGLERAMRRMGAKRQIIDLGSFQLGDLTELKIRLEHGIDVDLEDIEINAGGLLEYEGHQVVLYIPDQGSSIEKVLSDGSKGKKVHVANCTTLEMMKNSGRYERYVVRNGLSPMFEVTGTVRGGGAIEGEATLRVCKNCLKYLNYQNANNVRISARSEIAEQFSLEAFFAIYSSYFEHMPTRKAGDSLADRYSADWAQISNAYRASKGWKCQECAVDLSSRSNRRLLHTHHVDGVKSNNSSSNLWALCLDCHSKQPMHGHMFVSRTDRRLIQRLRSEQKRYTAPKPASKATSHWKEAIRYADPAVHGLLHELKVYGESVPEVGSDVVDPNSGRVVYSGAELVWPNKKEVVVLRRDDQCDALERIGWTVYLPQDLLDWLYE